MKLPPCDICGDAVTIEGGALAVSEAAAKRRILAIVNREAIGAAGSRGAPAASRRSPGPVPWMWGHRDCVGDRDFRIDALRVDQPMKAVSWTRDLWSTGWLAGTDWWATIERLHTFPEVL